MSKELRVLQALLSATTLMNEVRERQVKLQAAYAKYYETKDEKVLDDILNEMMAEGDNLMQKLNERIK